MTMLYLIVDDPLVGSIAQQYLNDREEHDRTAKEWTRRYVAGILVDGTNQKLF